ncbi:histone-like H-NS family protein [Octadecabacter antarcticus 307]|uniref:Histone-like H-NS family protein n=1 Tax=Octadecabacter antarcticus 307 TaxID=391626 RepID=M9RH07_9RHOB|nr:H-NS histone family protein [Octadecabacter antarcticus]AGI69115.1 histone-like H-NS family protein [Octadecabacter antarcticus 307]
MEDIMNLRELSLSKLKQLQKEAALAVATRETQLRQEARAKLESVAAEYGLGLDEIMGAPTLNKGGKMSYPPLYRNPGDPEQTWSGRGRRPLWLLKLLETGHDLSEYLI